MTLSAKILLSYLALGGGVGGIYIGVNGGIGNKAIEEVSEPVDAPDVVEPEVKDAKTEEHAEEKDKGVGTEETLEIKPQEKEGSTLVSDEVKEAPRSKTSDETTEQTKITDNNEDAKQKTDLELQVIESVPVPTVEIQVAQAIPEIKRQALKVEINPPAPAETKESVFSVPIKTPTPTQSTQKTEKASSKTSNSSGEEKTGMAWIVGKAKEYRAQLQETTSIIRTIKRSFLG